MFEKLRVRRQTKTNIDFIKKMLEIYLKQTPENLSTINQAMSTKQYSEIAAVAHKMRSSVPYVGLKEAEKLLLGFSVNVPLLKKKLV